MKPKPGSEALYAIQPVNGWAHSTALEEHTGH